MLNIMLATSLRIRYVGSVACSHGVNAIAWGHVSVKIVHHDHAKAGWKAAACDIQYHQGMDMSTVKGFILALALVLKLAPGGVLVMAPVCSSWVFMSCLQHSKCCVRLTFDCCSYCLG